MLEKLKMLLRIDNNEKDDLLTLLLDQATETAMAYTHSSDFVGLSPIILKMAVFDYNRLGTEGLQSEGYSGVSFSYLDDYPETILRLLRSKRRIITLSFMIFKKSMSFPSLMIKTITDNHEKLKVPEEKQK